MIIETKRGLFITKSSFLRKKITLNNNEKYSLMKNAILFKSFLLASLIILFFSCNKKDDTAEEPTTGFLNGRVTALDDSVPIEAVRMIVFNANTNAPTGGTYFTDTAGYYSIELTPGSYQLKLSKLGYENIPAPGLAALPLPVTAGGTTTSDFQMAPSKLENGGVISGRVGSGDSYPGGVLVVAENAGAAFSSVTDAQGYYGIVNVAPGSYEVKGWMAGYNSSVKSATVNEGSEVTDVNLELTQSGATMVSGAITFLATQNIEVDVSLVHPKTRETIPGLITNTENGVYTMANVPDGLFLGRASWVNDQKVVDPDWIVKNGEPYITIAGSDASLDFSVTGAVKLTSPTNGLESTQPVEVSAGTPTFSWQAYPSASDYVPEVMDLNGTVIWGGFSDDWTVKNVVIPDSQTSVTFNFDGSATAPLEPGRVYRWRIYASKDDNQSATGWRLISVSEDQVGLIKIID